MPDTSPPSRPRPRKRDAALARKAAGDPRRPGAGCKAAPGQFRPVVALAKCEGKADCVAVCPYGVFEIGPIEAAAFSALPWTVRVRLWVHGKKTAFTPNADACQACGLCVVACPEMAITLVSEAAAETVSARISDPLDR